jgi:hypothetical protein
MDMILREMDKAIDAGLYYPAVMMALTLPDICSALASANGETGTGKYKDWYNAHLAATYPEITADDMWSLRNGVVHQGRFGHPKMQYARIVFAIPNQERRRIHRCTGGDALILDAIMFCKDVAQAVTAWFAANSNDRNVAANLSNLVQLRHSGFLPYVGGIPVIA